MSNSTAQRSFDEIEILKRNEQKRELNSRTHKRILQAKEIKNLTKSTKLKQL